MENVARSVLTNQLNQLDKKDRLLGDNPKFPPNLNIDLGAKVLLEHRVMQVLGTTFHFLFLKEGNFHKKIPFDAWTFLF